MITNSCPNCGKKQTSDAPSGLCPACLLRHTFADAPVPPPPEIELQQLAAAFPQLVIEELTGQGGMGRVYRAQQPHLHRTVALKVLSADRAHDPEWLERFNREARALARLSHPHIVQVYDFGETPIPYLLMEHVDGVNLRQAMQNGGLTAREALAIVPKLCDALQYAHENGVLHRDIKPENILIDTEGRVKLVDFGLAKLRDESAIPFTLTQSGAKLGTLAYMAPEQVEKPSEVDHRADIYSLGVVLYEMLTGELPLGRFPTPSEASGADARLDGVVMRTLEKKKEQRPASARALRTDLEAAWANPSASGSPSVRTQIAMLLVTAFAGILITLVRFTGLAAWLGLTLSSASGLLGLWQWLRLRAGATPKMLPWQHLSMGSLFSLAYFAMGGESTGPFFAAMGFMILVDGYLSASRQGLKWHFLYVGAFALGSLIFLLLILTLTSVFHEWLLESLKVHRVYLVALDTCGLVLALRLAIPRLRSAAAVFRKQKPDLALRPGERLIAAVFAVLLVPSFPHWMPRLHPNPLLTIGTTSATRTKTPEQTLAEAWRKKQEADKPVWQKTRAWVASAYKADTKAEQDKVLHEILTSLDSTDEPTLRSALNTLGRLHQIDFDRAPFREKARLHLESKSPDIRIAALSALNACKLEASDRDRLDRLAPLCTDDEITSLLFAYKTLFSGDFTGPNSSPVLALLERGMAAAQRLRSSYGIDSRHVLGVIWGCKVSPEIEARLIEWSHLDTDENGDIQVGNSRLGYNTFYHALSVVQNKSRASLKRLLELARHPDVTNVAGRCLWGMNGTVPDPADRAFLAGEVTKLLGLRSDDYMWENGLRLLRNSTPDQLPALQQLATRDTLSKERREALQQIIQSLQKPQ